MTVSDEDSASGLGPLAVGAGPSEARDKRVTERPAVLDGLPVEDLVRDVLSTVPTHLELPPEAATSPDSLAWSGKEHALPGLAPHPLECLLTEPLTRGNEVVHSPTETTHFFAYELESLASLSALGLRPGGYPRGFWKRKREFLTAVLGTGVSLELRMSSQPDAAAFTRGRVLVTLIGRVVGGTAEDAAELVPEIHRLQRTCLPEYRFHALPADAVAALLPPSRGEETLEVRRRVGWLDLDTWRPRGATKVRMGFSTAGLDDGPVAGATPAAAERGIFHIFSFAPSQAPLDRLFELLLTSPGRVCLSFRVEPAALGEAEGRFLESQIALCESHAQTGLRSGSEDLTAVRPTLQVRARGLERTLSRALDRLRYSAVMLRVRLAASGRVPRTLVHQVGALLSGPGAGSPSSALRGGYEVVPSDDAQSPSWLGWGETELPRVPRTPSGAGRLPFLFTLDEAAAALQLPPASPRTTLGVAMHSARELTPPHDLPLDGLLIGRVRYQEASQDFRVAAADRQQHVYVCGQTGTGKSTLLAGMILADIQRGEGVCLIDPHGDLYADVLQRIPADRLQDVVLVDPTDKDWPVGVNLLETRTPEERHFVIDGFMSLMERVLEDQYGAHGAKECTGPAFWQQVRMNLSLLMHDPARPATLLDFCAMFQENGYWKKWLPLASDEPQLKRWVENVLPNMDFTRAGNDNGISWGAYIGSKFERFIFFPPLRNMFAQARSTIDFRAIMDEGRILLVNLAKGDLTEINARFLGMVLLAKLQAAAMSRSDTAREKRRPFYLYVDEFGAVATGFFKSLLSEGRKFGISLVLANQFNKQIQDEAIREAIFGNVGTLVAFRTGHDDGKRLTEEYYPGPTARDFVGLPNWRAYARAIVRGRRVPAFVIETIPLPDVQDEATAWQARAHSRLTYGRQLVQGEAGVLPT